MGMRISTKGRYALRMLIDLAQHRDQGFVTLKEIAERQNISKKYLEQIIALLNRTDMLLSGRGFAGGYKLAKDPSCYSVGEILRVTEGSLAPVFCIEHGREKCPRAADCLTHPVWQGLNRVVEDYLNNITLQDVLDGQADAGANKAKA